MLQLDEAWRDRTKSYRWCMGVSGQEWGKTNNPVFTVRVSYQPLYQDSQALGCNSFGSSCKTFTFFWEKKKKNLLLPNSTPPKHLLDLLPGEGGSLVTLSYQTHLPVHCLEDSWDLPPPHTSSRTRALTQARFGNPSIRATVSFIFKAATGTYAWPQTSRWKGLLPATRIWSSSLTHTPGFATIFLYNARNTPWAVMGMGWTDPPYT